jgi:predicted RNA binding protein YcfA (HicA-like mRNA interferase family)
MKIHPISPEKMIKVLEKFGFKPIRQKGSHVILMNDERVRIVVPLHSGKKLKPALIRIIIKEAGITRDEFFEVLKKV